MFREFTQRYIGLKGSGIMSSGRMKRILYIDCFSGISGDMMAGALCDLGLDLDFLRNELKKIDIPLSKFPEQFLWLQDIILLILLQKYSFLYTFFISQ